MGADLMLEFLAIEDPGIPDWAAAVKWIEEHPKEALQAWREYWEDQGDAEQGEAYNEAQACDALKGVVDEVRQSFDHRDVGSVAFGKWTLWITGGMTSGEEPSSCADYWARFQGTGLHELAGFGWPGEEGHG